MVSVAAVTIIDAVFNMVRSFASLMAGCWLSAGPRVFGTGITLESMCYS